MLYQKVKEIKDKVINKYKLSFLAYLITYVLGFLIFCLNGRLLMGKYTFVHSDMLNQMIPFAKMFLRQLFCNHNIFYSFDFAMGSGTIPVYAFYNCFNPFNLIYLLPVDINFQGFLIVFGKLSLGAFFFQILCEKMSCRKNTISVVLAVCYALCGFNIAYYFVTIWQDGIYLLPIILICILKMLENGSNPFLIIAYSLLFIFNFYTGYIVGIYSFLFFVLFLFVFNNKKISVKIKMLVKYIMYVTLSGMISAIILLPTAIAVIKYASPEERTFESDIINGFDLLKQMFLGQAVDEVGNFPYIYVGLLPLIFGIMFFFCKNIDKKYKIIFGSIIAFLAVCATTIPGYKFIHAFNYPDNLGHRYAYLLSATVLLMSAISLSKINDIKKKGFVFVTGFLLVFIIVYSHIQRNLYTVNKFFDTFTVILINVIFLIVYLLVLLYTQKTESKMMILGLLMLVEVVINGLLFVNVYRIPEKKESFDRCFNEQVEIISELKKEQDVVRVYMPKVYIFNSSQMMGFRGVNSFSSILDPVRTITMRKLGYRTNYLMISDDGSTPLMRMILGQNYIVNNNNFNTNIVPEYHTNGALPICFMSSNDIISYSTCNSNNPFDNQNALLSSLCGETITFFYNSGNNVEIECDNMLIGNGIYDGEDVVGFEKEDENIEIASIRFYDTTFESKYAYFEMLDSYAYSDSPMILDKPYGTEWEFWTTYLSEPRIVKMGESETETEIYIYMDQGSSNNYYFKTAYFYGADKDELNRAYNILSINTVDIKEFKDGFVKAIVTSGEDKDILFTSIPYEDGWDLYIDGEKKSIIPLVDNTFMGVQVPYGSHEVVLKYTDRWAMKGGVISLVGLAFASVVFYLDLKKKVLIKEGKLEGDL